MAQKEEYFEYIEQTDVRIAVSAQRAPSYKNCSSPPSLHELIHLSLLPCCLLFFLHIHFSSAVVLMQQYQTPRAQQRTRVAVTRVGVGAFKGRAVNHSFSTAVVFVSRLVWFGVALISTAGEDLLY